MLVEDLDEPIEIAVATTAVVTPCLVDDLQHRYTVKFDANLRAVGMLNPTRDENVKMKARTWGGQGATAVINCEQDDILYMFIFDAIGD